MVAQPTTPVHAARRALETLTKLVPAIAAFFQDHSVELIAYIGMAAGAYAAVTTNSRKVVYYWFVLYAAYSLVARSLPPVIDMVVYSRAMTTWPPPLSFYTLREPLIWIGVPSLYFVLNNRLVTFLIIDLVTALVVVHAMRVLDHGDGRMFSFAPTVMTSYVFLLGQQVAWRQHVALVILLWAIASRSRHERHSVLLFALSVLSHNATAVFVGYWLDVGRRKRPRYGPALTITSVVAIHFTLPFLGKSAAATGLSTEYLYLLLAAGALLLLLFANYGRIPTAEIPALWNFIAFVPAVFILTSAPFERISMMFLIFIFVDLYRHHRSVLIDSSVVAQAAFLVLVVPTLIFPSTVFFLTR